MRSDAAKVPASGEAGVRAGEPAQAETAPVVAIDHRVRNDERESSTVLEVALDGAGHEEASQVLVGRGVFVVPEATVLRK